MPCAYRVVCCRVGHGGEKQQTLMEQRTRRTCHGGVLTVSFTDVCLNGKMPSMISLSIFVYSHEGVDIDSLGNFFLNYVVLVLISSFDLCI